MTINESIERQATYLASENRKGEPGITKVYWFPDDVEVRLVSLFDDMPISGDGLLHAFHFRASPLDDLPAPSAVALIRSEEFGKLKLPATWGTWQDAKEIGEA